MVAPGQIAPDLDGTDPTGAPLQVQTSGRDLILVFLTSDCKECLELWRDLEGRSPIPGLILVTPSAGGESKRKLQQLAPEGISVMMSSPAWHSYRAGPAPWCVIIEDGIVSETRPARTEDLRARRA